MANASSESERVAVYTDGACSANQQQAAKRIAAIGVYLGPDHPCNVSELMSAPPYSNNRAELSAILRGLTIIRDQHYQAATIFSDSQYAISCITEWYPGWERKGFVNSSGQPVANIDLIRPARELFVDLEQNVDVDIKYVPGHSGEEDGNFHADRLANEAISVAKRQKPADKKKPKPQGKKRKTTSPGAKGRSKALRQLLFQEGEFLVTTAAYGDDPAPAVSHVADPKTARALSAFLELDTDDKIKRVGDKTTYVELQKGDNSEEVVMVFASPRNFFKFSFPAANVQEVLNHVGQLVPE